MWCNEIKKQKWWIIRNWLSRLVDFAWWYVLAQSRWKVFKTYLTIKAFMKCFSLIFLHLEFLEYTTFDFFLFCILYLIFSHFFFLNTSSSQRIFGTFSDSKRRLGFCLLYSRNTFFMVLFRVWKSAAWSRWQGHFIFCCIKLTRAI